MECLAKYELSAFIRESIIKPPPLSFSPRAFSSLSLLILLPLVLWHAFRRGYFTPPSFIPSPDSWLFLGELDKVRVLFYHEYYRCLTALTLHADSSHLAGNVFFGAIFLLILSRAIGPGKAILLSILGGAAGNFISLFFHKSSYVSIGFSSALFAATGILGAIMMHRAYDKRHLLLAAGGAIGLLALLGTDGENTDYAAHVCGLACGLVCGFYEGWREKRPGFRLSQLAAAFLGVLLLFLAWLLAFNNMLK